MKKPPKKMPQRISKLLEALEPMFGLTAYERHIHVKKEDKDSVAAEVTTDEVYQRVNIYLYPVFFESSLRDQREFIVHEFCHTTNHPMLYLLDEFKAGRLVTPQQIRGASEKATSRMSTLVDTLLDGQWRSKRKAYKEYLKVAPKRKKR